MDREAISNRLRESDESLVRQLWDSADRVRRQYVGDVIHFRGLIELSNNCVRRCLYCGLHAGNARVERYRMSADEVLACGREAVRLGYGTVVLQGGEDYGLETQWIADLIRRIKGELSLAVTLSLGERGREEFQLWREAGADRYLLRFETSNGKLYRAIHPDYRRRVSDRVALLRVLADLGYEIGSGVMVGIPGQSFEDLVDDLLLFRELDLDMIGVGPFIKHPDTALGRGEGPAPLSDGDQVPNDARMTCTVMALARILCPEVNMPATTALATVDPESGRRLGLSCGGNVLMPNLMPGELRARYEIYPDKACLREEEGLVGLRAEMMRMGRTIGQGRGDSPRYVRRQRELCEGGRI